MLPVCRRDSAQPSIPAIPPPLDSKPAVSRQLSEITIAAGVPLPLSARRVFTKVAGCAALAMLAGVLVVAFARQPKSAHAGPLSSNVSMVPKTVVTQASDVPARAVRGKVDEKDAAAQRAGDTAAIAALAVTTSAAPSSSSSVMRTAHYTVPAKGKAAPTSMMKTAKFVPGAGAKAKAGVSTVKHSPRPGARAHHHAPASRGAKHAKRKLVHS